MNKTEITLDVERTIKTADFESLRVHTSVTEIVEWDNEKQREDGVAKVVSHLQSDFTKSYNMMVSSVGVERSLGIGTMTKSGVPVSKANVTSDDEFDMFEN